jgi:hypothetical protein
MTTTMPSVARIDDASAPTTMTTMTTMTTTTTTTTRS